MSDAAPLLRVTGLRTWFPVRAGLLQRPVAWVRAVDGVDLEVPAGKTVALVGESGCGKTTVGRSLLRLEQPQNGCVQFHDVDLLSLSPAALRPRTVNQSPPSSIRTTLRRRSILNCGPKSTPQPHRREIEPSWVESRTATGLG